MAHTMGRYTSSPESQLESDLNRISNLPTSDSETFISELDRIVAANFTTDYWEISLPNRLDTQSARSPALFAYLAALDLLDARVLFSEVRVRDLLDPGVNAPRSLERHHLFPKKYLASLGITATPQVNAIANMAFLDWAENAEVSDSAPATYWPGMTNNMAPDRLRQQVAHHALPVGWEQLDYSTFLNRRRPLMAKVIRDGFATLWSDHTPTTPPSVEDLINSGESQTTEFKSTARWNLRAGQVDPKMEHVIVKTVCGFLNADGGSLLIGVDDDGKAVGLDHDFASLGKANADGYELYLRQLVDTNLSAATAATVRIKFETVDEQTVCVVSVASSGKPGFTKPAEGAGADGAEFWVRIGNAIRQTPRRRHGRLPGRPLGVSPVREPDLGGARRSSVVRETATGSQSRPAARR